MSCEERFRRLVTAMDISISRMAEVFGTDHQTAGAWFAGKSRMGAEFRATLLRLEGDNLPALSPNLSPKTVQAFYEGRARAMRVREL